MTSYVDTIVNDIEAALKKANSELDKLQIQGPAVIERLVDVYLATFLPVPAPIKNAIVSRLEAELTEMIAYSREVIKVNEKMAHMLGSPDALRAGATALDDSVDKASGDLATDVRPNSLDAMNDDTKWNSGSSQRYANSFVGQNDAVDRIGHYGQILEATLGKLADAIEQFYVELLATVTTLVSAIVLGVVTIIAAVGVVTIPVGIGTVIGAILSVIAAGLGILAMVLTITQEVNDSLGDLHSNLQPWPSAKFAS